jgi:hypothetical protein
MSQAARAMIKPTMPIRIWESRHAREHREVSWFLLRRVSFQEPDRECAVRSD